ncbi:MAG TPA: outer membrane beta-barrel protein [Longimicrobiales bacterium]|nr:outer membrane beta-barrel protein [Longimicrobiales bacterium]
MRTFATLTGIAALTATLGASPLAAQGWYFTAAIGGEFSGTMSFEDFNCSATSPPALFGCSVGEDGDRALGAYGDYQSMTMELGIGNQISAVRIEARLAYRPSFAFVGNANFLNASKKQPVRTEVHSVGVALAGAVDLAIIDLGYSRLVPFIGASAGVSRHEVDEVVYRFPSLGAGALTRVPGGVTTAFTWSGSAGLSFHIDERVSVEGSYRYSDLGAVETEAGTAQVVRPKFKGTIDIAGTRSDLRTHAITAGLRVGL